MFKPVFQNLKLELLTKLLTSSWWSVQIMQANSTPVHRKHLCCGSACLLGPFIQEQNL